MKSLAPSAQGSQPLAEQEGCILLCAPQHVCFACMSWNGHGLLIHWSAARLCFY